MTDEEKKAGQEFKAEIGGFQVDGTVSVGDLVKTAVFTNKPLQFTCMIMKHSQTMTSLD